MGIFNNRYNGIIMASKRDKDYHKLRNGEKYFGKFWNHQITINGFWMRATTSEEAEAERNYDKLWSKYGYKSMVGNKRRRCNTRKSNQRYKKVERRIQRAQNKEQLLQTIQNIDDETILY